MACDHNWVWDSETATTVTHRCTRCGSKNTQNKGKSLLAALMLVMAACAALTIRGPA